MQYHFLQSDEQSEKAEASWSETNECKMPRPKRMTSDDITVQFIVENGRSREWHGPKTKDGDMPSTRDTG